MRAFFARISLVIIALTGAIIPVEAIAQKTTAVLDQQDPCERCGRYHSNKPNNSRLSVSASFQLHSGIVPNHLRLELWSDRRSGPSLKWKFELRPDIEIKGTGEERLWSGNHYIASLARDGTLSFMTQGLEPLSEKWNIVGEETYSYRLYVENQDRTTITTVDGTVKARPRKANDRDVIWSPFEDRVITFKEFREGDLRKFLVERKSDFSLHNIKSQAGPQKMYLIVPIYREFYNQNIGSFLISLAVQNYNPFGNQDVHIVFNVNNTRDAKQDVRIENRETVEFLQALSNGMVPKVRPTSEILRQAIFLVLASGMKIHVIDNTTPGYAERNIGRVRDEALKYVFQLIPPDQRSKTLIAQMDGDSRVPPNYLARLHEAFSDPELKYALMSLTFGTERGSNLQTYRRMIMAEIWFASYAFHDALAGRDPISGSPRIVATASALYGVGGVPHETSGEDTALVARLREYYRGRGRWLSDVAVETSFRGRPDGFDASYYLKRMDEKVELGKYEKEVLEDVKKAERDLDQKPEVASFRKRRVLEIISQREKDVRARLALLTLNLHELDSDGKIITRDPRVDMGMYTSPEFDAFISKAFQDNKRDVSATVKYVAEQFPHVLRVSPPLESVLLARVVAATDTILSRDHILSVAKNGSPKLPFLAGCEEKYVNVLFLRVVGQ